MGHGSGGKMMSDLIQHLFAPLLKNDLLDQLGDSTVIGLSQIANGNSPSTLRLAFTTDHCHQSVDFSGRRYWRTGVNGTVNDLAMSGAKPLFLSAGFILEEVADGNVGAHRRFCCRRLPRR